VRGRGFAQRVRDGNLLAINSLPRQAGRPREQLIQTVSRREQIVDRKELRSEKQVPVAADYQKRVQQFFVESLTSVEGEEVDFQRGRFVFRTGRHKEPLQQISTLAVLF